MRSFVRASGRVPVFYDPSYRLPLRAAPPEVALRRADAVRWFLAARRVVPAKLVTRPPRIAYRDLGRVHTTAYLDSLRLRETVARIFATPPEAVELDAVIAALRRACGGTLAASRLALEHHGPALNLLGGFHHAFPDRGGGGCVFNDVAVAIATLRAEGFSGRVAILDLDAHPPDGTAACLASDPRVWIGSISGSDWGALAGTPVEIALPPGAGDVPVLEALDRLLDARPRSALTFVLSGCDVLGGDALGQLAMTLAGARARDRRVADALAGSPSVWLPAGGYHPDAWKVLAGTALVLAGRADHEAVPDEDPLDARVAQVSRALSAERLGGAPPDDGVDESLAFDPTTTAEIEAELGLGAPAPPRVLGFYTPEGIEYGLHELGVLGHLERLGYHDFTIEVTEAELGGQRARLLGDSGGERHLLIECALERRRLPAPVDAEVVYVHWLSLRDPRGRFASARPALPGQDAPGLGLSREITAVFERMAQRLELAGVAFRPAWYHTAFVARRLYRFLDPARQGRFEALVRDLGAAGLDVASGSRALSEGRVWLGGAPYAWEADVMMQWRVPAVVDETTVTAAREATRFEVRAASSHDPTHLAPRARRP